MRSANPVAAAPIDRVEVLVGVLVGEPVEGARALVLAAPAQVGRLAAQASLRAAETRREVLTKAPARAWRPGGQGRDLGPRRAPLVKARWAADRRWHRRCQAGSSCPGSGSPNRGLSAWSRAERREL